MRTSIRCTAVAIGAAVTMGLMTAAPATAAAKCVGGFKKQLVGVGMVTYSVCTKTGEFGAPLRAIKGTLRDTRTDSAKIKLTVTMYHQPTKTGSWSWTKGGSAGTRTFETPWRVANAQSVLLKKV